MATGTTSEWVVLAGDFPPSLNSRNDASTLQPFESPDCYGADPDAPGFMRTSSVLTGDTRSVRTNTFVGKSWEWYYNRSWHDTGRILEYTAPDYDDADHRQGLGKLVADTDIVNHQPALGNSMWVVTGEGSQFVGNVTDERGFYSLDHLRQELLCDSAAQAVTLDGLPYVCNKKGVFRFDGQKTDEVTINVRGDTRFTSMGIRPDYQKKFIVGANQFVIDPSNGKLFRYSGSDFRFTSRQLLQGANARPFTVKEIAFVVEMSSTDNGIISWQTKFEDDDWFDEDDIKVQDVPGKRTRVEKLSNQPNQTAHKFQMRVTALSSNIYVRSIEARISNRALGSISE